MRQLSELEIAKIVTHYIGVKNGYLGDFNYKTHREFYLEYCGLSINPDEYSNGTTRERFIAVLRASEPQNQARIIRGVLKRFPVEAADAISSRNEKLHSELQNLATEIESEALIQRLGLRESSEVVHRALKDVQVFIEQGQYSSSVDRVHTALHGYLRALCRDHNIETKEDTITSLFKQIRNSHSSFQGSLAHKKHTDSMLNALANILNEMNTLRNQASLAHPNDQLLQEAEALLVLNAAHTVMQYLEVKLKPSPPRNN